MALMSAVWVLGTGAFSAARGETATVRLIGNLESTIAPALLKQVNVVPFTLLHDSAILLQGRTMSQLQESHQQELRETYQAGYPLVLLDAAMAHIAVLHEITGEGVTYRSPDTGVVMAYALRRENHIPTATLVPYVSRSPLRTPRGEPEPTGLQDEAQALNGAVDRTVTELRQRPQVSLPGPQDPNQSIAWQNNPVGAHNFFLNGPQGVYNTAINVYALHRCLDGLDYYMVTAEADWTATQARWEDASTNFDVGGPSTLSCPSVPEIDWPCTKDELIIDWQANDRTYCSSDGFNGNDSNICRYVNYPLSYTLTMTPLNTGTVNQVDASPPGAQGQQTSYTSGFNFSIGGSVNVSGVVFSAGATWVNTVQTVVPPLNINAGNTGSADQGAFWTFQYCTTGDDSDSGTDCTNHVQMVRDVCISKLGDPSSETNPQQGQTPNGKFSNAVQSAYWAAASDTRVGAQNFEIEVKFIANLAYTTAHLGTGGKLQGVPLDPDPDVGCNFAGCACVDETTPTPETAKFIFQIPFPSTVCQ
jgi:hypothetical protein